MIKITILKGDITTIKTKAIVNAANTSLLGGGGVDGAIHRKGGKQILAECIEIRNRQGGCKTGEAVITSGGNLPAKFVIHTVGPVWQDGNNNETKLLRNCYINTLKLASENQIDAIAFPNISTGIYGFPKKLAAETAALAVTAFQESVPHSGIREIIFVCFDDENYGIYLDLF
ncbi:MAG: O-acetyl-ADP-ribose deacetylase [Ferruginibacter sp.]